MRYVHTAEDQMKKAMEVLNSYNQDLIQKQVMDIEWLFIKIKNPET